MQVTPEMRAAVARQDCRDQGHNLEEILTYGSFEPQSVVCRRCGSTWGCTMSYDGLKEPEEPFSINPAPEARTVQGQGSNVADMSDAIWPSSAATFTPVDLPDLEADTVKASLSTEAGPVLDTTIEHKGSYADGYDLISLRGTWEHNDGISTTYMEVIEEGFQLIPDIEEVTIEGVQDAGDVWVEGRFTAHVKVQCDPRDTAETKLVEAGDLLMAALRQMRVDRDWCSMPDIMFNPSGEISFDSKVPR